MRFKTATLFIATPLIILLISTSCSRHRTCKEPTISTSTKNGPPAHAPAHGYRRKHVAGVEIRFDTKLGVYVVIGFPNHYYHEGYFYRVNEGTWEMSLKPDSHWKVMSDKSKLPIGLQVRAKANNNGNSKGKGKGKGKHKKDIVSIGKMF